MAQARPLASLPPAVKAQLEALVSAVRAALAQDLVSIIIHGSAVRGFATYVDRWTLCEIVGAADYTNAHSSTNVLTTARGFVTEGFATTTAISARIAARLHMPSEVLRSLATCFERWDGNGAPDGLQGEQIPLPARIVFPTFILAPMHRVGGRVRESIGSRGARP